MAVTIRDVAALAGRLPKDARPPDNQFMRLAVGESGVETVSATALASEAAFDAAYAVRSIADLVPNHFVAWDIVIALVRGLRERDWGCHEGAPVSTLPPRHACPEGGEPYEEMLARVTAATCLALESAGGRLPVLVAHSGVIRILRLLSGGSDGGPSAPNATPILFTPAATGWHERVLDKTMR